MKTIVALRGPKNVGKTTSIIAAHEHLMRAYPDSKSQTLRGPKVNRNHVDIKVVTAINGITVGIESQGDPDSDSKWLSSLKEFVVDCDVIACAVGKYTPRSRRNMENELIVLANLNQYQIKWIEKQAAPLGTNRAQENEATAQSIVEAVQAALIA